MSISPPSDIVSDVLRAAEPARQRAATQQLSRIAPAASARIDRPAFRPVPAGMPFDPATAMTTRHNKAALAGAAEPSTVTPHQQFESMVLQDFVQRMLPDNSSATFGEGTAGSVWKSWMAEAVAKEIAQSGGIGIADMLARKPETAASAPIVQPTSALPPERSMSTAVHLNPEPASRAPEASAPGGFFAKLQEAFLDMFGNQTRVSSLDDDPFRMSTERDV